MTAFHREKIEIGDRVYIVEIQSLNKKGLEVSCFCPKELFFSDNLFRKKVGEKISRGQVSVKIFSEKQGTEIFSKENLKRAYEELKDAAGSINKEDQVTLQMVLSTLMAGIQFDAGSEKLEAEMSQAIDKLLPHFIEKKKEEGKVLVKDLLMRLKVIEEATAKIEERTARLPDRYKEKILERLKEVNLVDDERVLREVVLYAEKADVSEEITRLKAHIAQLKALLNTKEEGSIGRQIDFLVQEMHREINTLSVKIGDLEAIQTALVAKQEVEKIREQGQNIE